MHLAGQSKPASSDAPSAHRRTWLRDGRAPRRDEPDGRDDDRRHAGLEADVAAREGGGAGVPRPAIRARHRADAAKDAWRASTEHRHPRHPEIPAQEVQGPDHRPGLRHGHAAADDRPRGGRSSPADAPARAGQARRARPEPAVRIHQRLRPPPRGPRVRALSPAAPRAASSASSARARTHPFVFTTAAVITTSGSSRPSSARRRLAARPALGHREVVAGPVSQHRAAAAAADSRPPRWTRRSRHASTRSTWSAPFQPPPPGRP